MRTVLHVIEQLSDYGGTPYKLLYLAAHDRNAHTLFATYRPSALQETFEGRGAKVINLDTLALLPLAAKIARLARKTQASVICTHFTRPLVAGVMAARLSGLPVLHFEHSSAAYRQGLAHHVARTVLPWSQGVICNSLHTARSVQQAYRLPARMVHVIYPPAEQRPANHCKAETRAQLSLPLDAVVIGHVGGMIPSRDQATLLKAFRNVHRHCTKARLLLIGDGPQRGQLEQLARDLGIESQTDFLGYRQDIGDLLQAMDIYVNPTLDEGFGIAVVEAMLAGLPVVLAAAGAHPELIQDQREGFLYAPEDEAALGDRLLKLIESPDLGNTVGAAARSRARLRFTPAAYVQRYTDIIDAVLAVGNGRASMRRERGG